MNEYRHNPTGAPLLWATKTVVFAVDPETGALRWRCNIPKVQRLFRLGSRAFVLTVQGISCIDIETGQLVGSVALGFIPTAGIVTANRLFVAGPEGAAALAENGTVLWSAKQTSALFNKSPVYDCVDSQGRQLWHQEVGYCSGPKDHPGLLFEDQVAQPDLDST